MELDAASSISTPFAAFSYKSDPTLQLWASYFKMEKLEHSPPPPSAPPPESPSVEIEMSFAGPAEQASLSTLALPAATAEQAANLGTVAAGQANQSTVAAEQTNQRTPASPPLSHPHRISPEWLALIMGFCFTAIAMGLQCQNSIHQSISLHAARLCLVFALSTFVVSRYIPPNFGPHAQVLEDSGVFCGVTGFFLAVTVNSSLYLKLISWIMYAFSLIAIILYRCWDCFKQS